ncbi:hypothetical protein IAR50_003505 [Cryptococcus sp. DSM 104548]
MPPRYFGGIPKIVSRWPPKVVHQRAFPKVRQWASTFPLDKLRFTGSSAVSRMAKQSMYVAIYSLKGARIIYDSSVNGRLSSVYRATVSPIAKIDPSMAGTSQEGQQVSQEMFITNESVLTYVMMKNYFRSLTKAIKAGLPPHLHGQWVVYPGSHCGSTDICYVVDGKIVAVVEIKLPSVSTTPGESKKSQKPQEPPKPQKLPKPAKLQLETFVAACEQEGGVKLIFVEGKNGVDVKFVDNNGKIKKKIGSLGGWAVPALGASYLGHWADGLSQLLEQVTLFKVDLVTLSSYDVWIPFERDTHTRNLFHMDPPIHRAEPGSAPKPGELTPMELGMAAVIPRGATPQMAHPFPPLSEPSLSE